MMTTTGTDEGRAQRILRAFAARTGLTGGGAQRRYLWTDAFAVCNYLTLLQRTGDPEYRELALRLIDRVHHVLGRHRADDPREGWISGLDEQQGELHPTAGGLRIGKPLNERRPSEPYDPAAEWDRDGQYFHYLVRWVHALDRAADVLEEPTLHEWAVELARASHAGFAHRPVGNAAPRLHWKMSVDLSRPLVPSQGAHDPLDGLVTFAALHALGLSREIDELWSMLDSAAWPTDDTLGIGGLLTDLWWVAQLLEQPDADRERLHPLLGRLMQASIVSLEALARGSALRRPLEQRLAFRELGLAIGLRALDAFLGSDGPMAEQAGGSGATRLLGQYVPLADHLTQMWSAPEARATEGWLAHEDINDVMLATALVPDELIRV